MSATCNISNNAIIPPLYDHNPESITPVMVSSAIRSYKATGEILSMIAAAQSLTHEQIFDALERRVSEEVFIALFDKVETISESCLMCAIVSNNKNVVELMLKSPKLVLSKEWVYERTPRFSIEQLEFIFKMHPDIEVEKLSIVRKWIVERKNFRAERLSHILSSYPDIKLTIDECANLFEFKFGEWPRQGHQRGTDSSIPDPEIVFEIAMNHYLKDPQNPISLSDLRTIAEKCLYVELSTNLCVALARRYVESAGVCFEDLDNNFDLHTFVRNLTDSHPNLVGRVVEAISNEGAQKSTHF